MKGKIKTITLLITLILATSNFGMVEPNEVGQEEIEAAKKEIDVAKVKMKEAQVEVKRAKDETDKASNEIKKAMKERQEAMEGVLETQARLLRTPTPYSSRGAGVTRSIRGWGEETENVLVIPSSEMEAKELLTIQEDMTVMSRILKKSVGEVQTRSGRGALSNMYFHMKEGDIQSIYLDGYGALFLLKVDFPLLPAIEPEKEEQVEKEDIDPVWEETRKEIYMSDEERREIRRRVSLEGEKYDAEKVEKLKEQLIKALQHSANIRHLQREDQVIITVTGEERRVVKVKEEGILGDLSETSVYLQTSVDEEQKVVFTGVPVRESTSPTTLTIVAKKSDIDAFAKGDLDLEQFSKRISIYTY